MRISLSLSHTHAVGTFFSFHSTPTMHQFLCLYRPRQQLATGVLKSCDLLHFPVECGCSDRKTGGVCKLFYSFFVFIFSSQTTLVNEKSWLFISFSLRLTMEKRKTKKNIFLLFLVLMVSRFQSYNGEIASREMFILHIAVL